MGLAAWGVAVALMASACSSPFQDLGPLPSRSPAAPLPADTVVRELTTALAAEGITVQRTPQDLAPLDCHETLTGQHNAAAASADLKAGFARARSDHGWQPGPDLGAGSLALRRGNWTAATTLPATADTGSPTTLVVITLLCDDAGGKSSAGSPAPGPTAS
ncbi:hypothetical protein ACF08N_27110 [Streptomyces sp. NPDC015127]|uniref:hypothetical protein n=1 Tax=Streptomyces sp. NPDC015127 TaxID=3364939 RepID=UPI0036F766A9